MANKVYEENIIELIDGTKITVGPSKIKYLRGILDSFNKINKDSTEDEAIEIMVESVRIAMQEFYPSISDSIESIEDNLDIKTVYKVLEYCAGIKINSDQEETVENQAKSQSDGSSWQDLDLVKLESEAFLIGAWKDLFLCQS
jgi:Mor family transcriptional regulator